FRQAALDANAAVGADTITFQAGLTGTITLTTGQLTLTDSVTITGPGANVLTVSGNNSGRVFRILTGVTAAISGLTVANGLSSTEGGAGIYNNGALTLTACVIRNNTDNSSYGGGGIANSPGAVMTVADCLFTQNHAWFGAAVYVRNTGTQSVMT